MRTIGYIRRNNLKGKKYGKWTVLAFSHINKSRSAFWKVQCTCGNLKIVPALNLRKKTSTQCRQCASKLKTSIYNQGNKRKYLYIFKLNSYYKIGVSDTWQKRLNHLNINQPYKVSCILIIKNHKGLEKSMHLKYNNKKVKGEWFKLSLNDIKEIKLACVAGACNV